jgi:hypothetical protein
VTPRRARVAVRIAVAIDRNGSWSAAGNCAYQSSDEVIQAALDCLPLENSFPRGVVWVNAEVPLPVIQEIRGVVECTYDTGSAADGECY